MPTFDIRPDISQARRMLKKLGPGVNRAASRAINKTLTPVRAEASRQIKKKRNLRIGVIKKQLRVYRATYRRLIGSIIASGKPIPIREFGARQSRLGVSVKITQQGKRTRLSRYGNKAFQIEKFGNHVYVRKTKDRLPIHKWPPVPGIPSVFVQRQVSQAMQRIADSVWPKRFREELRHEIRKAEAGSRRA